MRYTSGIFINIDGSHYTYLARVPIDKRDELGISEEHNGIWILPEDAAFARPCCTPTRVKILLLSSR